jgi:hypothetical protein
MDLLYRAAVIESERSRIIAHTKSRKIAVSRVKVNDFSIACAQTWGAVSGLVLHEIIFGDTFRAIVTWRAYLAGMSQ